MKIFFFLILVLPMFILVNNNPIYSLLALIFTFINFSFLLFSLKLEFLALAYLIVYVGAICVLFIFVILLLNLRFFTNYKSNKTFVYVPLFFIIFFSFNKSDIALSFKDYSLIFQHKNDLELFANSFFVQQYPYFILAGFLLLLAIIACIYLTLYNVPSKKILYYYE